MDREEQVRARLAGRRESAGALLGNGAQADMFGAEGEVVAVERRAGPGRPAGAGSKLKSKLREYMAVRGYRDPAEQLAMLAGLDRPDLHPLAYAAQIALELGEDTMAVAGMMRQAAAELMPYWHAKLTPDVAVGAPQVNILMQGAGGVVGVQVEGGVDPFAPLDVRLMRAGEIEQYQGLGDGAGEASDAGIRTQGASD